MELGALRKSTPLSEEQKKILVEFMRKNDHLQKGKFTNNFTLKDATKLWNEIADILNAVPGASKNWKEWRRTWHDLRARVKTKSSKIKKNITGTGGGTPAMNLSMIEEDVASILSNTAMNGITTRESTAMVVTCTSETELQLSTETIPEESTSETVTQTNVNETSHANENAAFISDNKKKSKVRLEKTISVASQMSEQWKTRTQFEEEYGRQKLTLLQRKLELKERELNIAERKAAASERIAAAQEQIAQTVANIANCLYQFADSCT